MRRFSFAMITLAACAPVGVILDPPPPKVEEASAPSEPKEATRLEGLSIVKTQGGGRAKRVHLGTLETEELDRSGGLGGRGHRGVGIGGGGYGGGGLGLGGMGTGGFGRGSGGTGGGETGVAGEGKERELLAFGEPSAFGYAEIKLPYRGGRIAQFEPRADARINTVIELSERTPDLLSTFAVDVDTAAYAIARRTISSGRAPEPALVRVEEFVNYFRYDYAPPSGEGELFSIEADGVRSPFPGGEHVLRIGLQARVVNDAQRPPANLVFLVDTSGSMMSSDKLELAKQSLAIAAGRLRPEDRVAITTYAGGVRVVLPPTSAGDRERILGALRTLEAGGGTAMESGLTLAYQQAGKMLGPGRITRVIVCSDGDANIGNSSAEKMLEQIAGWVSEGVTLSTIGFGDGNYKDATMEQIANKGNGNYYYIDDVAQAQRVFGRDFTKMIYDVAQDVKIQVALNPDVVHAYRLIGYENRDIADRDFRNDRVDAGEIGAGHQVTALYALTLAPHPRGRLATVYVRAKRPRGMSAKETALVVPASLVDRPYESAPDDLRFAVSVMGAAEIFRLSPYASGWKLEQIATLARDAGADELPERREFVSLVDRARSL